MGSLIINSLCNYCWVWRWKNFENRSTLWARIKCPVFWLTGSSCWEHVSYSRHTGINNWKSDSWDTTTIAFDRAWSKTVCINASRGLSAKAKFACYTYKWRLSFGIFFINELINPFICRTWGCAKKSQWFLRRIDRPLYADHCRLGCDAPTRATEADGKVNNMY